MGHVLDSGPDHQWQRAIFGGKGRPIVKYRDDLPSAAQKNSSTDPDAVWDAESRGPKEPCITWGVQMPQWEWTLLGECLAHCRAQDFGGSGKTVSCTKMGGPILTIYKWYDVLLHKVFLGVAM